MATVAAKAAVPISHGVLAVAGLVLGAVSIYLSASSKPSGSRSCPSGMEIDPTTGLCGVKLPPCNSSAPYACEACPSGTSYNSTTGFCEQQSCPQGQIGTPPNCKPVQGVQSGGAPPCPSSVPNPCPGTPLMAASGAYGACYEDPTEAAFAQTQGWVPCTLG